MPRKSAAALAVVAPTTRSARPRLVPSTHAPDEVKAIFAEITAAAPPDHFRQADAHLIERYAEAIALARRAAVELDTHGPVVEGRTSPWLTVQAAAHKSSVALAARLRLSPQHRADSRSAGRKASGPQLSPYDQDDGA